MANHHSGFDHCCSVVEASSVQQSMGEMEFERGIWSAACNGEDDKVQRLLNQGMHPDSLDSSGLTALHYAARHGHLCVCQHLVSRGADVNRGTRSGGTPALHRASYQGHLEVVRLLLQAGANPGIRDGDGQTALHKSAERAQKDVATLLLTSHKELANIKDNRGRLPKDLLPAADKSNMDDLLTPS